MVATTVDKRVAYWEEMMAAYWDDFSVASMVLPLAALMVVH